MRALAFWKTVTLDQSEFLQRFFDLLERHGIRYAVIGGQAVNAYAEPLVSLDLDLVVAADQMEAAENLLAANFTVKRFAHSLNLSEPGSDLRIQIQTDPRYATFIDRAEPREVLGLTLPVAAVEDVLQGKIWAVQDAERRGSKRQKDLADIARLLDSRPELRSAVPDDVLARLIE